MVDCYNNKGKASEEFLVKRAVLKGHQGWVTRISTPQSEDSNIFISASRDKKVVVWKIQPDYDNYAVPVRSLSGHSQSIQDCSMSLDGNFALSASWDKSLRLWNLETGVSIRSFNGHTSDVFSCAFSPDNRQIVSGSRDKSIKLWNTLAECKFTVCKDQHTDWISCVRFSPVSPTLIVSCGWDKLAKVWDISKCDLSYDLMGHNGVLHTVAISPDGSLCASGGKDGVAMLWDANHGVYLSSLEAHSPINALCFSPCHYWLCAATDNNVKVWSLESSQQVLSVVSQKEENNNMKLPWCTSLQWMADGKTLLVGTSSGDIHVYENKTKRPTPENH